VNAKAKKILYGSLLAGSTALLVPTVLSSGKEAPAPPPEIPAEGPVVLEGEGFADEPELARAGLIPTLEITPPASSPPGPLELVELAERSVEQPARALDPVEAERAELEELASRSSLVESLEQSLGLLENFAPAAGIPDLDRMATSWSGPNVDVGTDAGEGTAPLVGASTLELDVLAEYIRANPITGIIRGESESAALIGGRFVRLGDELHAGAVVEAIEARALVVNYRGQPLRLELPPLRPRTRPASSVGESDVTQDEGESTSGATTPETTTEGGDA